LEQRNAWTVRCGVLMDWPALISALFFALGCAPLAFFQVACPCCRGCIWCTSGTQPSQLQVVVSGISNNSCLDCASVDGTYVLDSAAPSGTTCVWGLDISGACSYIGVGALVSSATNLTVFIFRSGALTSLSWRVSPPPDCATWSSLSLPVNANDGTTCTATGSTCLVTSL
jgi:hypothetical protein